MNLKVNQRQAEYKELLTNAIKEVETATRVEIVAVIKKESDTYYAYLLLFAVIFQFAGFSFLMFVPIVLGDYLFYCLTIACFVVSFIMAVVIVPLKRILIPKKIKARMVMINALATFQKAGISLTRNRTGLLIYYSQFEQIVQVVADEGVKRNLPVKEIEHIDEIFSNIHRQKNPVLAFIGQVINLKEILSKYLPTTPDDINELPDNLDINL